MDNRKTMLLMATAASLGGLLSGCVSYGGIPRSNTKVVVQNSQQIELRQPDVLDAPEGIRVHGWACRRLRAFVAGSSILVERISVDGNTVESASGRIDTTRLAEHPVGCVVYDVKTAWRLEPDETVRVSVSRR